MLDLAALDDGVEELDGRGCRRSPGSSTAIPTRASPATASRSSRSARAARLRGAARARRRDPLDVRATRAAARTGSRRRSRGTWAGCGAGTTTFEAKSGYGLDRETELRSCDHPRRGRRRDLARRARRPARVRGRGRRCVRRVPPRGGAARGGQLAEAADVFLERGRSTPSRRAAISTRARDAGLALRLHGDQFTEAGAIPLAIELGARSVDHLEATGLTGSRRSPRATSPACCCRRARSSSTGRCRRRARSSTRRGGRARDRLQPGSAFCESLPLVCSLARRSWGCRPRRRSPRAR